MYDDKFFKKKQLLGQRNALLEGIGLEIYEKGELPQAFRQLPQEFRGMEILVHQLHDRYRTLREERDRVHLDYDKYLNQVAKLENEFNKNLRGPRSQLNEIHLKIQYLNDQMTRAPSRFKKKDQLEALEREAAGISMEIKRLESEKASSQAKLRERMDPLGRRLRKLDDAISEVQSEEDLLSYKRQKRLRDLGYWFYSQRRKGARFESHYKKLDVLRVALADARGTEKPESFETPQKDGSVQWGWVLVLILAVVAIGYVFRTQFREEDVPLAGIARAFLPQDRDYRVFAELGRVERALVAEVIPDLASLPGGEVFRGIQQGDISAFLVSRQNSVDGPLKFCGLKFRKSPTRFNQKLTQLGWENIPSSSAWQALAKGPWVWIVLNQSEFFLCAAEHLQAFQMLDIPPSPETILLFSPMEPFGNNRPLLQGYDHLQLSVTEQNFQINLSSNQTIAEPELRKIYLAALRRGSESETRLRLVGSGLNMAGPSNLFKIKSLRVSDLRQFITMQTPSQNLAPPVSGAMRETVADAGRIALDGLNEIYAQAPHSFRQRLMMFDTRGAGLHLLEDVAIGLDLRGLAFLQEEQALLAADQRGKDLMKLSRAGDYLLLTQFLAFKGNDPTSLAADLDFNPGQVVVTRQGDFAVVLEQAPSIPNQPRILLLRTRDLEPLWVEDLPRGVANALSAVWDPSGEILVVGCTAGRRRADVALGVLVYRRDANLLRLTKVIPLPLLGGDWLQIPSLTYHDRNETVLAYQYPQGRLYAISLDQDELEPEISDIHDAPTDAKLLTGQRGSHSLVLNRTGDLLLLAESRGAASPAPIHLIDLRATGLAILDSIDLEMQPFTCLRIPLSDRFWIGGRESGQLAKIRIENRGLVVEEIFHLEGFKPEHLATDRLGAYLFLTGKEEL